MEFFICIVIVLTNGNRNSHLLGTGMISLCIYLFTSTNTGTRWYCPFLVWEFLLFLFVVSVSWSFHSQNTCKKLSAHTNDSTNSMLLFYIGFAWTSFLFKCSTSLRCLRKLLAVNSTADVPPAENTPSTSMKLLCACIDWWMRGWIYHVAFDFSFCYQNLF